MIFIDLPKLTAVSFQKVVARFVIKFCCTFRVKIGKIDCQLE
jgi:hypothetical protein